MEDTLVDVQNHIVHKRERTFKRLRYFVVNHIATIDFPNKYWYRGCSVPRLNGTFCARANCEHKRGLYLIFYRFQLQLTNRSSSSPFIVTIFYEAQKLIGMSAEQLSRQSPESQKDLVRAATSKAEECFVDIRVKEDLYSGKFVAIVQKLHAGVVDEDDIINKIMSTLRSSAGFAGSPGEFYTPRGECSAIGNTSGGESSSVEKGVPGCNRVASLSSVKTKLKDNLDIIDLTLDE